jgi:Transposase, Mutator family
MTCLTVCVVPLGSVTDSPMCGTAKKLQVCSVSIDWWPRYTVHEIVIEGAYRAELPKIALCPMPGYSTTARKFKLRHYPNPEHPDEENIRTEQTREHLRALIEGRLGTAPARSSLVLLAARLILEEALEGEVRDEIGRERYERANGKAKGYRNGYRPSQMKTAEGVVEFCAPQVRDTPEPFVSQCERILLVARRRLRIWLSNSMHAGVDPRH